MSRIAKMGVSVPAGVDVKLGDEQITVKGSGGELKLAANPLVKVAANGANLSFAPADESREANAMSGTMRQRFHRRQCGCQQRCDPERHGHGGGCKQHRHHQEWRHLEPGQ